MNISSPEWHIEPISTGLIQAERILSVLCDIQTEFQFGEKSDKDDKDIRISIEKNIDENNQEIIIVDAIGKGSVTMEDIENELERVFAEQNIDASAGIIKYYVTLDDESNFK